MSQAVSRAENVAARLIDRHVQASLGDRRAFDYGSRSYSYHDLAALVNRAGNLLASLGVEPGARVLVALPHSPAFLSSVIGAVKIGALPTVIAPPGDAAAASACMKAATPAIAVVHADYLPKLSGALAVLGPARTVVVGETPPGHPSFVESMRSQSSSLTPAPMPPDAPALTVVRDDAVAVTLSHRDLEALLAGDGSGDDRGLGSLAGILRALAGAEAAQLS